MFKKKIMLNCYRSIPRIKIKEATLFAIELNAARSRKLNMWQ